MAGALLLALAGLAAAAPSGGRVLTLEVDRLDTPVANMDAVVVSLDWPQDATEGALTLTAATLDAGEFGYRWRNLRWTCVLRRQTAGWNCAGPIKARGASGLTLSARLEPDGIVLEATGGGARVGLRQPHAEAAPMRVELARVPATWLAPLLAQVWEDAHPTGGRVGLDWQVQVGADRIGFSGPLTLVGLGLDTRDGSIAAEAINVSGKVRGSLEETTTAVELTLALNGGEVLYGPLYVALPATPVQLGMKLSSSAADQWRIEALRWRDPGTLELDGAVRLDVAAASPLQDADLKFVLPALGAGYTRYFESVAASSGLAGMKVDGAAHGALTWRAGEWDALDITLQGVDLEDGQRRFGAQSLAGNLRLQRGPGAVESDLAWRSAHVYELGLGAATLPLRSAGGGIALRAPVAIPLFDGVLRINTFDYAPQDADVRLDMGLALERVNLGALSSAFGWPTFAGTISGDLPSVHYAGDRLEFEGGLSAAVFDGQVKVAQLSMERPFGVAPTLAASIEFSELDLEPLTGAFGFGEITGRLDGHVRRLRLIDWEPVAFDAALQTVKRSGVRRRISQRAVRDLTEVGGGGIAAGLQMQVLKAFSSFGYEHIGLSCVLANNVCTMGGIETATGSGYTIVKGSGLPQVNVIGHQRRVDWPVLVSRLTAATQGQMPVID